MLRAPSILGAVPRRFRLVAPLLVACLLVGVTWVSGTGRAYAATNSAVSYADGHWNWSYYTQNSSYWSGYVSEGAAQPNFQCAEFVARALATEGLLPGLSSGSAQSSYGSYRGYDLLSITSTSGLYNYLVDYGMGTNVGTDLSKAAPGDVVVFKDSSGTRQHTVLITSVGSSTSSTYIDAHNDAHYHATLSYEISGFASWYILHITNTANACPATLTQGDSGTWVSVLKYVLNSYEHNYHFSTSSPAQWSYPLTPSDTTFTQNTTNAVTDFQYWAGLGASGGGQVGGRTWSLLGFCETYQTNSIVDDTAIMTETNCPSGLSNGDSGTWVKALQMRLNEAYYYGVFKNNSPDNFYPYLLVDGSYGSDTTGAVTNFQYAVGIGSSGGGGVGNRTWSEIGMCW